VRNARGHVRADVTISVGDRTLATQTQSVQ